MTTTETTGETSSSPQSRAEGKSQRASEYLDSWEQSLGLPKFAKPSVANEAVELLERSPEERRKMPPLECAIAAVTLAQFAVFINRAQQREEAEAARCRNEVTRLLAPRILETRAYHWEERRALALRENQDARVIDQLAGLAQAKATRLAYYAREIGRVSQSYENLSKVSRRD